MKFRGNSPFFALLGTVWLYLLGLCLLIGFLVVPIEAESQFLRIVIGSSKVLISMVLILIWLISWFKVLGTLFHYELSMSETTEAK